jgi:hypothetical protein
LPGYNVRVGVRVSRYVVEDIHIERAYFEEALTDEALISALEEHGRLLATLQRERQLAITIVDCADSFSLSARQRRIQGEWNRSAQDLERLTTLGKCFVMRSILSRGMLTAVNWFSPPAIQPRVVASLDEAMVWVYELCEGAGVSLSEPTRRAIRSRLCEP